ncbi:MAG: glycerol-3-phosphate 1-O-acyltransferase PlsY [Calditrichia bacterium]
MLFLALAVLISYLVGSFPTAILTGKILKGFDIRQHGSGNAGATNVFRVLGWKAGLFVLLVDMAKGLLATILIYKLALGHVAMDAVLLKIICGLAAVFGHIFTVFAGFKGGKGVGTGAGMIIGLLPGAVLSGLIVFIITVWLTRYVSLGSILASITVLIYVIVQKWVLGVPVHPALLVFGALIPVLIIFTHRSNIGRLLKGNENKIQFK